MVAECEVFQIAFTDIPGGLYELRPEFPSDSRLCAHPGTREVTVDPVTPATEADFTVGPAILLAGRVEAAKGPLTRLSIMVRDPRSGQFVGGTRPREDGSFVCDPVLEGRYDLVATDGEERTLSAVSVGPDSDENVVIVIP